MTAAAASEDGCLLLVLSHDELGVIFDGLADPLQPVLAVAFSSTCKGLRTPLVVALFMLTQRHVRALALCRKLDYVGRDEHDRCCEFEMSVEELRDSKTLHCDARTLTAADMATLSMILLTNGLPKLQELHLIGSCRHPGDVVDFGDEAMQALCEGLGGGAAPSLRELDCPELSFGPAGAASLASALRRGAFPKLESLCLGKAPIGNQGAIAVAAVLRKLPVLRRLDLGECRIDDEGVASLVAGLGQDDFRSLKQFWLDGNRIRDAGCASLIAALNAGALPAIETLYDTENVACLSNFVSEEACEAVDAALLARTGGQGEPEEGEGGDEAGEHNHA